MSENMCVYVRVGERQRGQGRMTGRMHFCIHIRRLSVGA